MWGMGIFFSECENSKFVKFMLVHFTDLAVTQKRELYTSKGENPHKWSNLIHWNCVF